jgi:hypothetical protein
MTARTRIWIETIIAAACGVLAIVTLLWRDWIELSGWDPDHHDGSAEWLIIAALAVVAVLAGLLAWRERHQLTLETPG